MKTWGFVLVLLFSVYGHAQQKCTDLFKVENSTSSMVSESSLLPENFKELSIYDRAEMLDYAVISLKQEMEKSPRPGIVGRWFTREGAEKNREFLKLKQQRAELKQLQEAYRVVMSLLHGQVKRHNLDRKDELQLLNRLMVEKEILPVLQFLDKRQIDLHGKDRLEQYFIDSVVIYLAWGPNPRKFPVPIKKWLIFDIFLGHKDAKYMVNMSFIFRDMAKEYELAKQGLDPVDAKLADYTLLMQDRVFDMIEKTEKKNPHIIERLLEQEITRGHVVVDENGEYRIVDPTI